MASINIDNVKSQNISHVFCNTFIKIDFIIIFVLKSCFTIINNYFIFIFSLFLFFSDFIIYYFYSFSKSLLLALIIKLLFMLLFSFINNIKINNLFISLYFVEMLRTLKSLIILIIVNIFYLAISKSFILYPLFIISPSTILI